MNDKIAKKIEDFIDNIDINEKDTPEYKRLLKCAAHRLSKLNPAEFEDFIEYVDGVLHYNNFITHREYNTILDSLKNSDGTNVLKYRSLDTLRTHLEEQKKEIEKKPYFNFYSLALTMNLIMSDHREVINRYIDNELLDDFCYDLAVSRNIDRDNPRWLRKHFGLE